MSNDNILELMFIVKSCSNNLNPKWNHQFDEIVEKRCTDFCNKHSINITHGSAYKELQHKSYYYKDKCIKSIIDGNGDLYELYKNKIVTNKMIVDKLIKKAVLK